MRVAGVRGACLDLRAPNFEIGEFKILCLKHDSMIQTVEPCVLYTAAQYMSSGWLEYSHSPQPFWKLWNTTPLQRHVTCTSNAFDENQRRQISGRGIICALWTWSAVPSVTVFATLIFWGWHRESRNAASISYTNRSILPTFDKPRMLEKELPQTQTIY